MNTLKETSEFIERNNEEEEEKSVCIPYIPTFKNYIARLRPLNLALNNIDRYFRWVTFWVGLVHFLVGLHFGLLFELSYFLGFLGYITFWVGLLSGSLFGLHYFLD